MRFPSLSVLIELTLLGTIFLIVFLRGDTTTSRQNSEKTPGPEILPPANTDVNLIAKDAFLNNIPTEEQHIVPKKANNVLLLSSLGRSGSTLMAEILRTHKNSALFFEPGFKIARTPCSRAGICYSNYLKSIFKCTFTDEFENWYKNKLIFSHFFTDDLNECLKTKGNTAQMCFEKFPIKDICKKSDVRIIKVIRARLGYLNDLLKDPEVNVKIVYLARDPRAAGNSIKNMHWNHNPYEMCSSVESDLKAFRYFVSLYPNQLINITYEELSLKPIATVTKVFKFIFGYEELPVATRDYVEKHMEPEKSQSGALNTIRESKSHFQKWRWEIPEDYLIECQSQRLCKESVTMLGYRIFKNFEELRNEDVSLFLDENMYN